MTQTLRDMLYVWPGQELLGQKLSIQLGMALASWQFRRFPDGESYLRFIDSPKQNRIILLASLDHPDEKLAPLLWFAATARELGAQKIFLVAPYLPYLRQDTRFQEGEAITSRYFAKLISAHFDGLLTVDPHLHRYHDLSEVYSIPACAASSAQEIGRWVQTHFDNPLILGPDIESTPWVSEVARQCQAPFTVAHKQRLSDFEVKVTLPNLEPYADRQAIFVDDVISTGHTLIKAIAEWKKSGGSPALCIGVHGIFSEGAYEKLLAAGSREVVTSNSIVHASNRIDLTPLLADGVKRLF